MITYGYADDIGLLASARREIDWKLLENTMRQVTDWSRVNGLLLNVRKSNYIFGKTNAGIDRQIGMHGDACDALGSCSCEVIARASRTK